MEGAERQVLEGMPFDVVRPWIVLVEAIEPNSQIMNHHLWEDILIKNEYEFVYFDGLNRFYIAAEHSELRDAFQVPPNFFDKFIRFSELRAEERSEALRGQLHDTNQRLDETTKRLDETTKRLDETTQRLGDTERVLGETTRELEVVRLSRAALKKEIQVVLGSRSWRITKPLRLTGTALRAVKYKMSWKPLAKRLFFWLYYRIIKWPWFFSRVSKTIGVLWPSLHTRLRLLVLAKQESETILLGEAQSSLNGDLPQKTTLPFDKSLSPRELDVLREFKYWENVVQIKAGKKQ